MLLLLALLLTLLLRFRCCGSCDVTWRGRGRGRSARRLLPMYSGGTRITFTIKAAFKLR